MKRWVVWLAAAAMLGGCARPKVGRDVVPAPQQAPNQDAAPATPTAPSPAPPAPAKGVNLVSPTDKQVLAAGPLEIKLEAAGEAIVALAQVDGDQPLLVKSGESAKVDGLQPGAHVLRVVPLDANGVLSTAPDGLVVRVFTIGPKALELADTKLDGPILTVGRPLGPTALDGELVPLDIRLDHVTLAEKGTQVRWQVDGGESHSLYDYPPAEPLSMAGLSLGGHTLKVWLERDGKPVTNGALAKAERKFEALGKPVKG